MDDTLSKVMDGVASARGALVKADHPWTDAQLAQLYDAFAFDADVPLYLELARSEGGRVLELACGSGRLLLPLAEAGNQVVGVDVSPHMLQLARAKLEAHPDVRLVQADMRAFDVDGEFDLAIVAVKSFAYLTEAEAQLQALLCIRRHLRKGGLLAIDLLHPKPEWIAASSGSMRDDLVQYSVEHGFTLSRVESVVSTDLSRQIRVIRSAYEAIDDRGALVAKRFVEWPYRWIHRFEAEHLLARAGFEVESVHGGYQREPFTSDAPAMLILARR
ncbi:MAG TPA: class I SAM-dependent methyltransferase [Chloroflexota bacterium]